MSLVPQTGEGAQQRTSAAHHRGGDQEDDHRKSVQGAAGPPEKLHRAQRGTLQGTIRHYCMGIKCIKLK